jgi:hypothetical protein
MDPGADARVHQVSVQSVATLGADNIEVEDVFVQRIFAWRDHIGSREELRVPTGMATASNSPVCEVRQLRSEHGGLKRVEAFAVADLVVLVLAGSPVITQLAHMR